MELTLKKEIITNKIACRTLGVAVFIILTALGAFVRIPLSFTPVPLTLQTFFVLLSASFLGRRLGVLAQASYILLGGLGIPIFSASTSGAAYLLGPTAGYLFGFVAANFYLGNRVTRLGKKYLAIVFDFFVASLIILFCGSIWLKLTLGYPLSKALYMGFLPFLPTDAGKALAAAALYMRLESRIKCIF